jgi:hypothetical protein
VKDHIAGTIASQQREGSVVTALGGELDELIDGVPAPARSQVRRRRVVAQLSSKLDCLVPGVGVTGLSSRDQRRQIIVGHFRLRH